MRALAQWRLLRALLCRRTADAPVGSYARRLCQSLVLPASFYLMIAAYQLCNWYNLGYADDVLGRDRLALPLDDWIPFTPWVLPVYLSFFGFFRLHRSLVLQGVAGMRQYRTLESGLVAVTCVSCAIFLYFPSQVELRDAALDSLRPGVLPPWLASACAGLYALDGSFNAWPSLHVSLPLLIMLATTHLALFGRWQTLCLWLWLVAVVSSVVLLKQHYVWDVLSAVIMVTLVWVLWLRPRLDGVSTLPVRRLPQERAA